MLLLIYQGSILSLRYNKSWGTLFTSCYILRCILLFKGMIFQVIPSDIFISLACDIYCFKIKDFSFSVGIWGSICYIFTMRLVTSACVWENFSAFWGGQLCRKVLSFSQDYCGLQVADFCPLFWKMTSLWINQCCISLKTEKG